MAARNKASRGVDDSGGESSPPRGGSADELSTNVLKLHVDRVGARSHQDSLASSSSQSSSPDKGRVTLRTRSGSLIPENTSSPWPSTPGANILDDMDLSKKLSGDALQSGEPLMAVEATELENLAFLLISFGYMVPWTSLGSLISYFKHTYNANFYNKLYCAYYLPGLPVAFLQHRFDIAVDQQLGSRNAYMLRGTTSFLVMVGILVGMVWWREQDTLILLFTVLGIFGWLAHGTASMLASMYPATAIAYLQTGFRCPEIYTIAIVAALNIGSHPSDRALDVFFLVTALMVSAGLVVWLLVSSSDTSRRYFDLKDSRMNLMVGDGGEMGAGTGTETETGTAMGADSERLPLLGPLGRNMGPHDEADHDTEVDDMFDSVSAVMESGSATEIAQSSSGRAKASKAARGKSHAALKAAEDASMRCRVYLKVFSLCLALFITIWCSIFQASFFAYCDSPQGRDIEQILYFVRLFADLLGRPLTRLPRPWFLRRDSHVLMAALLRVSLMALFFFYIFLPSFPRCAIRTQAHPTTLSSSNP